MNTLESKYERIYVNPRACLRIYPSREEVNEQYEKNIKIRDNFRLNPDAFDQAEKKIIFRSNTKEYHDMYAKEILVFFVTR